MSASSSPLVVVGIPVWQGANFVGETLRSVLAQEGVALRVVISVDGRDEASAAACVPFLSEARVKLVVQSSRLGWVRNSAVVLAAAVAEAADYACIQPHDDITARGIVGGSWSVLGRPLQRRRNEPNGFAVRSRT